MGAPASGADSAVPGQGVSQVAKDAGTGPLTLSEALDYLEMGYPRVVKDGKSYSCAEVVREEMKTAREALEVAEHVICNDVSEQDIEDVSHAYLSERLELAQAAIAVLHVPGANTP